MGNKVNADRDGWGLLCEHLPESTCAGLLWAGWNSTRLVPYRVVSNEPYRRTVVPPQDYRGGRWRTHQAWEIQVSHWSRPHLIVIGSKAVAQNAGRLDGAGLEMEV
jgi:hypothetical protein